MWRKQIRNGFRFDFSKGKDFTYGKRLESHLEQYVVSYSRISGHVKTKSNEPNLFKHGSMSKLFMHRASHQLVDGWLYFKLTMIIIIDKVGIGDGRHPTFFHFRGRGIGLLSAFCSYPLVGTVATW